MHFVTGHLIRHALKPETPKQNYRNETTETPDRKQRNQRDHRNHQKDYKNLNKTIATASIAPPLLNSDRIVMNNDIIFHLQLKVCHAM